MRRTELSVAKNNTALGAPKVHGNLQRNDGASSKGRTTVFGTVDLGSIPSAPNNQTESSRDGQVAGTKASWNG